MPYVSLVDAHAKFVWLRQSLINPAEIIGRHPWEWTDDPARLKLAICDAIFSGERVADTVPTVIDDEPISWNVEIHPIPRVEVAACIISKPNPSGFERLTRTEKQVFRLLPDKRITEIAQEIGVSRSTIETHRSHIAQKLGVSGPRLVALAARHT